MTKSRHKKQSHQSSSIQYPSPHHLHFAIRPCPPTHWQGTHLAKSAETKVRPAILLTVLYTLFKFHSQKDISVLYNQKNSQKLQLTHNTRHAQWLHTNPSKSLNRQIKHCGRPRNLRQTDIGPRTNSKTVFSKKHAYNIREHTIPNSLKLSLPSGTATHTLSSKMQSLLPSEP